MEWIWIPLAAALIDWTALAKRWDRLQPVTKPAVPVFAAVWILLAAGAPSGRLGWVLAGLLFALAGDVLLLPRFDRFVPALSAFLLTHLAWIAALNRTPPPLNLSTAMLAAATAFPAVAVTRRVRAAMRTAAPGARTAVPAYVVVLSVMLFSGLATLAREEWPPAAAILAATGVVLFALSDVVLVWNRYVAPLPYARLRKRVLYHAGMLGVVGGILVLGP